MLKRKYLEIGEGISRAGFMSCLGMALFKLGVFYHTFARRGQSVLEFFSSRQLIEYDVLSGPPQIYLDQVAAYNGIIRLIYIALLFITLIFIFDYYVDRDNHFITTIKYKIMPKLEKVVAKLRLEDD